MLTAVARVTLLVEDQQRTLGWYRDVLGFEVVYDQEVDGYRYLHIGVPGQPDVGLWLMPAGDGAKALVGNQTGGEPLHRRPRRGPRPHRAARCGGVGRPRRRAQQVAPPP